MSLENVLEEIVRRVIREELAARPAASEFVTIATYATSHAIGESTVRQAIKEGRLQATKIGRSVRIASDAAIGEPAQAKASKTQHALRALGVTGGGK